MADLQPDATPDARTTQPGAIARALAHFAHSTTPGAIPPEVRNRALHHILDAVGIALAVSRFDYAARAVRGLAGVSGPGDVPVLGFPLAWSARDAATINGLLCHGLDFDDTHLEGIIHPTVAQFPAALSAAVMAGTTTREMVTAYIIGVETADRIAAVAKGGFHRAGFHPTGVCNTPAAALAAGRLLGLSEGELAHAQGIALSMASGVLEFLEDGAWTKRLHPGWAASSGIVAASMAKAGYVGATSPYSGRFGLYRSYVGGEAFDFGRATRGLGTEWELLNTAIKPYPACHLAHGCIDAAIAIHAEEGFDPADIVSVETFVAADTVPTICEPLEAKRRPKNSYDAQFSIPYLVATALVRGRVSIADLDEGSLRDPGLLGLAGKVGYAHDPRSGYPKHYSGEVIVALSDGRRIGRRQQVNSGAPERPVTDAEIVRKFEGNASTALSSGQVEELKALILSADGDKPARDWAAALGRFH
ncbi:MAG: MmgE/PrpD family protein [Rhizobiaceae bacterium]|nr:MmgE/PrpD family protein [Rhizobiaceae bacterium]